MMAAVQGDPDGADLPRERDHIGAVGVDQPEPANSISGGTASVTPNVGDPDGSDVVALARRFGVTGFTSNAAPVGPVGTPAEAKPSAALSGSTGAPADGADVVALAREVGLAGFRAASQVQGATPATTSTAKDTAGGAPVSSRAAASPVARAAAGREEHFALFTTIGSEGVRQLQNWEHRHGSLTGLTAKALHWRSEKGTGNLLFRVPDARVAASLRHVQGQFGSPEFRLKIVDGAISSQSNQAADLPRWVIGALVR